MTFRSFAVGIASRPDDADDIPIDIDEVDEMDSDLESCGVLAKGAGAGGGMNAAMLRWLLNPNDIRPLREAMAGAKSPTPRTRGAVA